MGTRRSIAALSLLFAFAACGPSASSELKRLATSKSAIVGGTTDDTDTNVFGLILNYFNSTTQSQTTYLGSAICSGTLIASHTIVTAAHCVDWRGPDTVTNGVAPSGSRSILILASNVNDINSATPSQFIAATLQEYSPTWDPSALAGDVGMVLLGSNPGVPVKLWNTTDISADTGQPIRVIGYGITSGTGTDSGVRRQVNLTMQNITATHFDVGNGTQGICHGDSGGPSLFTFPDGSERVVGIHSYTDTMACTSGADTRIDAYQSWISGWITQHDAPTCAADGVCVAGCSPVDPDCIPIGQPCQASSQCDSRQCVNDPQHPNNYCSQTCTVPSECPAAMVCASGVCNFPQLATANPGQACVPGSNYCLNDTVCSGRVAGAAHCQAPCTTGADCTGNTVCITGFNGMNYCQGPPVLVTLQGGLSEPAELGPTASGCAAAGGGPWVALALLSALRRRRARDLSASATRR